MPRTPHPSISFRSSLTENLEILAGRFTFPQGQATIAAVPFDLIPRRAAGVERLRRATLSLSGRIPARWPDFSAFRLQGARPCRVRFPASHFCCLRPIAVPGDSLRGDEQGQSNRTDSGRGTSVVTGSSTYTYSDSTATGTVDVEALQWQCDGTIATTGFGCYGGINAARAATRTSPTPIPAGPVFYIIIEEAGMGDTVRAVPCTGKETVLAAVGHVNGIPEVSNAKIWIARPSAGNRSKSTILNVDWEAVSKQWRQHDELHALARRSPGARRGPCNYEKQLAGEEDEPYRAGHGRRQLDDFHDQRFA